MPTSYGGESAPSRGPVLFGVAVAAIAANIVIFEWGDFKVSKMLPAYPDKPRTVESVGPVHTSDLESKLAKAKQSILDLTAQEVPEDRETKAEEKERWEEQKEHLIERVAELEMELEEKSEQLSRVLDKARHEELGDADSAFIASLAGGES